jgi:hypothetical protein
MIDDMALLKQAMEQMDAEDPVAAQAAKDRAAQTLSDARLNFAKMADLIEQRRLLLRPRIVASIKRMDQPGMLGDSAFRDAGSALRKEGQSFYQIAEAIELTGGLTPPSEDMVQNSEPLHQMAREPRASAWPRALVSIARIIFFPLRHPIRFAALALLAVLLFYAVRGFVTLGRQVSEYLDGVATVRRSADKAMSSVGSFVNDQILRPSKEPATLQSKEAAAPPALPAPVASAPAAPPSPAAPPATPGPAPATAAAPPATAPAPSATAPAPSATAPAPSATAPAPSASGSAPLASASAPPAPPSTAPAAPSVAPPGPAAPSPRRDARSGLPSRSAANCGAARQDCYPQCCRYAPSEDNRPRALEGPRALEDIIPEGLRRNSRTAGQCIGGVGGCYWGGGQY